MLASSAEDRGFGFKWLLNLYTLVLVFDKDAAVMNTTKDFFFGHTCILTTLSQRAT